MQSLQEGQHHRLLFNLKGYFNKLKNKCKMIESENWRKFFLFHNMKKTRISFL